MSMHGAIRGTVCDDSLNPVSDKTIVHCALFSNHPDNSKISLSEEISSDLWKHRCSSGLTNCGAYVVLSVEGDVRVCIFDVSVSWGPRGKNETSVLMTLLAIVLWRQQPTCLEIYSFLEIFHKQFWHSTVHLINCHHGDLKEIKEMEWSILNLGNARSSLWPWWRKTKPFLVEKIYGTLSWNSKLCITKTSGHCHVTAK